jgi:hypothetical protein
MNLVPSLLIIAITLATIDANAGVESRRSRRLKKMTVKTDTPPQQQHPIQVALDSLTNYANVQRTLTIQNPDIAYAMRKALVIADLIIQTDGTLNISLCPSVKASFIPSNPEEYEVNMGKVLDQLDASWQGVFANIQAPTDPNSVSSLVLRGMFSLAPNQPLTDRHAKMAVLAAMLSPYNQGPVGNCFAVNDVIRDHQEYYRHAVEDYQAIAMNGFIQRPVNNTRDNFFFLPILADSDRDQPFNLGSDGSFPNTNYSLLDAPGFAAAVTAMGGNGISGLSDTVVGMLSSNAQGDPFQVTPSQVIAAIAQAVASQTSADANALSASGQYAFSALTNNTVLRAVEGCFAAMAEDRPNDSTRGNINACVDQALSSTWDSLNGTDGVDQFQQTFDQTFNSSYRLLYNLNIPLAQVSSDGSSTDGGFQLYQRVSQTPAQPGNRIATPQQFQQLLLQAISDTQNQLGSTSDVQTIASTLTSAVNTGDFLKNALWAYDQANQQEPDPVQNYQKLSRTPMQSCDGDNPYEVDDIDTDVTYDNNVQHYTPSNANDLITWCLNLAKTAPPELIPLDSPQHAFNFVPGNPDIAAFVKNGMPANQWLQNMLVVPGLQVSRQTIPAATQQALANGMYNQIANALSDSSSYKRLVQGLSKQTLTVKDYSTNLLNGINKLLGSNQNQAHEVALVLDALLLQALPANASAILSQSAIRFAFTNWNQGTKDIYFCAFFNPRTEQIGFGTIFEDKTNLQPMDEDAWVNHQPWDVDLSPTAPKSSRKPSLMKR